MTNMEAVVKAKIIMRNHLTLMHSLVIQKKTMDFSTSTLMTCLKMMHLEETSLILVAMTVLLTPCSMMTCLLDLVKQHFIMKHIHQVSHILESFHPPDGPVGASTSVFVFSSLLAPFRIIFSFPIH